MKNIHLMLLVMLAGCASAKQVKGPNGENAYLVQCGKAVQEACTRKSAEVCPNGYRMLERDADSYDDLTKVGNAGKLEIKADTTQFMLIECK